MLEQYQSIWVKGEETIPGVRNCAHRFDLITPLLDRYTRPFTVLDLGANLGYFSLRILEDYPEATVVAAEDLYSDWLRAVVADNDDPDRLIILSKKFSLDDLRSLGEVEHFDVVLALSVVHHIDGRYDDILGALRGLGDNLVLELPVESTACGQAVVNDVTIPADAEILGYGESHLTDQERPIAWVRDSKDQLAHAYVGSPFPLAHMRVDSTFHVKHVFFNTRPEHRDWVRGINLQTFLSLGGVYPSRERIAEMVIREFDPDEGCTDVQPWNVVLSGDSVTFIDKDDPRMGEPYMVRDLSRVMDALA